MDLNELIIYRRQILDDSKDPEGYISDGGFLENCLPWLNDTKYIDSTDIQDVYDNLSGGTIKANAYLLNESGERLQLFLVNEDSLILDSDNEQLLISQKGYYDKQFNRCISLVKKSVKKQLNSFLQDGSPAWLLVHQLGNSEFLDQIDVIEIFLLSATATIESRGTSPSAKTIEFDDEVINVSYTQSNAKKTKEIIIKKRLIDLNFLYNVHIAEGSRYPLVIDFTEPRFGNPIPFLQAADESDFDSYLVSFPAALLATLYREFSSRLLEKNVRSFLQLKTSVNKGMQDTIKKSPEKFIAYNNGLTITATSAEIVKIDGMPHIKSLSDFQIVNGGQTTATLYFSSKQGLSIEKVRVMAKINVAKNASDDELDELISDISKYSNAQTKVSLVDLRARSAQLVKLKSLSESILTVSGKKWFFERAKGEYATLIRINSSKKSQIERNYPKHRRFTKEQLAKYYSAWGDKPYAVKKGGEKIFRLFIEDLESKVKRVSVNRQFYEDLISRIILFRGLEDLYGSGKNAIGQLRSAVIPYTLSVLYVNTTGNKNEHSFDMLKIWKYEKIEDDLNDFFVRLMELMNSLIKDYSKSDDVGEYSKKQELWEEIKDSREVQKFMSDAANKKIVKKYSISKEELQKRDKESSKLAFLDFEPLRKIATIFDRGTVFYKAILSANLFTPSQSQQSKINEIIYSINKHLNIDTDLVEFERKLLKEISLNYPTLLPTNSIGNIYSNTVSYIVDKYNSSYNAGKSSQDKFDGIKEVLKAKKVKYYSVFGEIGKNLDNSELPTMYQIKQASEYIRTLNESFFD